MECLLSIPRPVASPMCHPTIFPVHAKNIFETLDDAAVFNCKKAWGFSGVDGERSFVFIFSKKTGEQIAGIEVHRPMNVADEIDALIDSYEKAIRNS